MTGSPEVAIGRDIGGRTYRRITCSLNTRASPTNPFFEPSIPKAKKVPNFSLVSSPLAFFFFIIIIIIIIPHIHAYPIHIPWPAAGLAVDPMTWTGPRPSAWHPVLPGRWPWRCDAPWASGVPWSPGAPGSWKLSQFSIDIRGTSWFLIV